jgi:hypothetical protein
MTWIKLIEKNREKIAEKLKTAYLDACKQNPNYSYQNTVLLFDDGDVGLDCRDINTWTVAEHEGEAIKIHAFNNSATEDFISGDWDNDIEGYEDYCLEYFDADEIIDEKIKDLKIDESCSGGY